jgi:hypothetical protein
MKERRWHLLLCAAERGAFLAITTIGALLAILGILHHNQFWDPGGTLGLTVISGGAAVRLHFLRVRST